MPCFYAQCAQMMYTLNVIRDVLQGTSSAQHSQVLDSIPRVAKNSWDEEKKLSYEMSLETQRSEYNFQFKARLIYTMSSNPGKVTSCLKWGCWGWQGSLVVKSLYCSFRGPNFSSQYPCQVAQPTITPALGALTQSFRPHGYLCTEYTHAYTHVEIIHKIENCCQMLRQLWSCVFDHNVTADLSVHRHLLLIYIKSWVLQILIGSLIIG